MADLEDPLPHLTPDQEKAVLAPVEDLPNWNCPGYRIHSLPGAAQYSRLFPTGCSRRSAHPVLQRRASPIFERALEKGVVSTRRHNSGAVATRDSVL